MSGKLIALIVLVVAVGVAGVSMMDEGLQNAEDGNLTSNQSDNVSTVFAVSIDVIGLLALVIAGALTIGSLRVIG